MIEVSSLGRVLVIGGAILLVVGGVLMFADRVPFLGWIGRLPGDILIRRGNTTIYVPIVTSIILSVLLTLVLSLFFRRQ